MNMNNVAKPLIAEFIGTFALIFIGVLSIVAVNITQAPNGLNNLTSIGLAHGLTITVMVAALGAISGGHFNPAVTSAFMATGLLNPVLGAMYIAAQLAGAAAAALLVSGLFGQTFVGMGTPILAPNVSATTGIIVEIITTFFLVLVCFGTTLDERAPKSVSSLAIGLTVAVGVMATSPLTGAAMNPARAFGPALASGMWANHLVYWVGPIIGGVLAGLVQNFILIERKSS
ncbi:MAG: aquaporin [Candidatus Kapaibacterium sp.]|nr:MAG: aquaporin [Candidatus Kapabacteria bacterium]